jgi:biotin operon repressor
MSIRIMSAVFMTPMDDPTAKFVLIALADNASDDGENCYPSVQTLSLKTALSESTIHKVLRRLKEAGILTMHGRSKYRTIHYHINIGKIANLNKSKTNLNKYNRPQRCTTYTHVGVPRTPEPSVKPSIYSACAQIENPVNFADYGGDEMPYSDPLWDIAHGKTPTPQAAGRERLNQMRNAANRFSPNLQELAFAFQEASGGILSAEHLKRDAKALLEMLEAGVTPEIIRDATGAMQKNGLAVTWPGAVTKSAIGIVNIRQARLLAEYEAEAAKEQPVAPTNPTPASQRRRPNVRRWSSD